MKRVQWQKKKDDKRQEKMQNELDCKFIRINPDGKDYDGYVEFSKIITLMNQIKNELKNQLKNNLKNH